MLSNEMGRREFLGDIAKLAGGVVVTKVVPESIGVPQRPDGKVDLRSQVGRIDTDITKLLREPAYLQQVALKINSDPVTLGSRLKEMQSLLKEAEGVSYPSMPGENPDFNGDGVVDILDFSHLSARWGANVFVPSQYDWLAVSLIGSEFHYNIHHFWSMAANYGRRITAKALCSVYSLLSQEGNSFGTQDVLEIARQAAVEPVSRQWARCDIAKPGPDGNPVRGWNNRVDNSDIIFALQTLGQENPKEGMRAFGELNRQSGRLRISSEVMKQLERIVVAAVEK